MRREPDSSVLLLSLLSGHTQVSCRCYFQSFAGFVSTVMTLAQLLLFLSLAAVQQVLAAQKESKCDISSHPRNLTLTNDNLSYTLKWERPRTPLESELSSKNTLVITYNVYLAVELRTGELFNWVPLVRCTNLHTTSCLFQLKNIDYNYVVSVQAINGACISDRTLSTVFLAPRNSSLLSPPKFKVRRGKNDIFIHPEPVENIKPSSGDNDMDKSSLIDIFLRLQYQVELTTSENQTDRTLAEVTTTEINVPTHICANKAKAMLSQCCVRLRFLVPDLVGEGYPLGTGNWSEWKCFNVTEIPSTATPVTEPRVHMGSFIITSAILLSLIGFAFSTWAACKSWKIYREIFKQKPDVPESLERVMADSPDLHSSAETSSLEIHDILKKLPKKLSLAIKTNKKDAIVLDTEDVTLNPTKTNIDSNSKCYGDMLIHDYPRCSCDFVGPPRWRCRQCSRSSASSAIYNQSYTRTNGSFTKFVGVNETRCIHSDSRRNSFFDFQASWENREDNDFPHFDSVFNSDTEPDIHDACDHSTPNEAFNHRCGKLNDYVMEVSEAGRSGLSHRSMFFPQPFNTESSVLQKDFAVGGSIDHSLQLPNTSLDSVERGHSSLKTSSDHTGNNDSFDLVEDDDIFSEKLLKKLNDITLTPPRETAVRSASVDCPPSWNPSENFSETASLFSGSFPERNVALPDHLLQNINKPNRFPESDSAYVTMDDVSESISRVPLIQTSDYVRVCDAQTKENGKLYFV
uniref:uncharacterized protein LOC108949756 n=1 Tax=Ciona intestinalis TaxID=7719 RepID=UPI00089DD415|nr:uncharacterized protein LOC108949756 [Ciona intestinalis]|eukprot:XP_018668821.1 uncharacterized protein LOC108949756 [Ciona intestinalis]